MFSLLSRIQEAISGKKVYLLASSSILLSLAAWSQNQLSLWGLLAALHAALLAMAGRAAIAKATPLAGDDDCRLLDAPQPAVRPPTTNFTGSGASKALTLFIVALIVSGSVWADIVADTAAQSTNGNVITTAAVQLPKITALVSPDAALNVSTNWLATVANKLNFSGVYIVQANNGKAQIDRGGISTEYGIREYDWKTNLRFIPGLCVTFPSTLDYTIINAGCCMGLVPNGKLEETLDHTPIIELLAKTVKLSELYLFLGFGSQYDQWRPDIIFGGGVKIW